MNLLSITLRRVSDMLAMVAGVCVVLMMLHVAADVSMRYLFNRPIQGTIEIVSHYYMVILVFFSFAMIERRHEHIHVTLFVQIMPRRVQNWIYAGGCFAASVFYGLLTYQTFRDAMRATRIGETMMGTTNVVIWPSRWAVPIGFFLIALAVLLNGLAALREPDTFDPVPEEGEDPYSLLRADDR